MPREITTSINSVLIRNKIVNIDSTGVGKMVAIYVTGMYKSYALDEEIAKSFEDFNKAFAFSQDSQGRQFFLENGNLPSLLQEKLNNPPSEGGVIVYGFTNYSNFANKFDASVPVDETHTVSDAFQRLCAQIAEQEGLDLSNGDKIFG